MKRISIYLYLSLIIYSTSTAQNVGGHGNGQASPSEVKAGELTKGAYNADINLFTGALSSSYTLGSVSTPSGLSYTLSMNYSSSYSGGNDVPLVNGIPYGEGWSLNVPTISVTTEAYSKYTRAAMNSNNIPGGAYNTYTSSEAGLEATPFWFAADISIPGVISERFIYKYTEGTNGDIASAGNGDMVFVPSKFDTYVEARLRDNLWKVILADGTVYEFGLAVVGYRNASNQKYVQANTTTQQTNGEYIPGTPAAAAYVPKIEILSWKATKIYHPNYPNNQSIQFVYDRFGAFDYHREFQQYKFLAAGPTIGYNFSTYKDVILKEVISAEDFGGEFIEKIDLNYRTQKYTGTPSASSHEMLLPWAVDVTPKDSLYNFYTVYSKGVESSEISRFDPNAITSDFSDWLRYPHVRSDDAQGFTVANHVVNSNPYVYTELGTATDGGANMDPGHTSEYLIHNKAIATGVNADDIRFNHSFLESNLINKPEIKAGDIYELRTLISKSSDSPSDFCNFDVNIVAGDNRTPEAIPSSISSIYYNTYKSHRSTTVFSTFNTPVKWNITNAGAGSVLTSNFFSLSNLPKNFDGIRIQVGPGNSDHNFGLYGGSQPDGSAIEDDHTHPGEIPNSFNAYNNYINASSPNEVGCAPIPENFGIGLEWHMMRKIYSDMLDYTYNAHCSRYHFWWNLNIPNSKPYWDNVPTAADNEVQLSAVELIRYSKNPYMLNYVRTYRCNGVNQTTGKSNIVLTSMLKMDYEVVKDTVKDNFDPTEGAPTSGDYGNYFHSKYIYLLKTIQEIPVHSSNPDGIYALPDTSIVPTTHFGYTKMNMNFYASGNSSFNYNTLDDGDSRINGNTYPLTKITDRLGGETKYQYYRPSELMLLNDLYVWHPLGGDMISHHSYVSGELIMASPQTITFNLCVKKKTVTDATSSTIPKEWLYSYETPKIQIKTPTDLGDHFDVETTRKEAGFQKTIVMEPLIDGNPNRIRTEYTHYTDENSYLLFGKLKQSIAYDAGNHMVEKKVYEYSTNQAYANGLLRSNNYINSYSILRDYFVDHKGDYDQYGTVDFYSTFPTTPSPVSGIGFTQGMRFLEGDYPGLLGTFFLNSYFIPLIKETTTSYDNVILNKVTAGLRSSFVSPVGIGSIKQITNQMASNITYSTALNGIYLGQTSITNITEYEYWDADYTGLTHSNGYRTLLGVASTISPLLVFEPSWELYKKTSYSPQLPGASATEENFYFHDLRNFVNEVALGDTLMNLYGLNWSARYHMRNLPYETRVTSKTQGKDPVTKSTYYYYDDRFNEEEENERDITEVTHAFNNPDCHLTDGSGDPYEGPERPADDCIEPHGGLDIFPPPGYKLVVDANGYSWWCPYTLDDFSHHEEDPGRTVNFVYKNDKLFLRYTTVQVDEQDKGDPLYNDPGQNKILRFALINDVYQPIFPFATLQNYYVEERNVYGQVKLDHDEKGLKTHYTYSRPVNIKFIDNATSNPCPSYTITSIPNIGLPSDITVGFGLDNALTTTYNYNLDHSVNLITDPNGETSSYGYDIYGRLAATAKNGLTTSTNKYHNWENIFTQSFEDRAKENYVESYTINDFNSNVAEHSRAYIDPQGRKYDVLTQVSPDYTNSSLYDTKMVHSGLTIYDNWNRNIKQFKPFATGDGTSPETFVPQFNTSYDPKTEQQYENTQRSKLLRASKYGESITTGHTVNSSYKLIKGPAMASELSLTVAEKALLMPGTLAQYTFLKTAVIDEDGKKVITYADAMGRQVAMKTYITYNNAAVTLFVYNSTGQQELVINPLKHQSIYKYNLLGQLYLKTTVDAGEVRYIHNASGQVVLEQDANAKLGLDNGDILNPYIRRYIYDEFGRLVKQERVSFPQDEEHAFQNPFYWLAYPDDGMDRLMEFSSATTTDFAFNLQHYNTLWQRWDNTNPNDHLTPYALEKEFFYHYELNSTTYPNYSALQSNVTAYLGNHPQNKLLGKLSSSTSYDNNGVAVDYKIYSYNTFGLPEYEIEQFKKGSNTLTSAINYSEYNLRGSLKSEVVDIDLDENNDVTYSNTYDGLNRLQNVYANNGQIASYEYDDALGLLIKTNYFTKGYGEGCSVATDEIDYKYDVRDRLTDIGSHLYNENLYYDNYHSATGTTVYNVAESSNFNGNINAIKSTYEMNQADNYSSIGNSMDGSTYYGYKYDGMNRLTNADASVMNVLSSAVNTNPALKYGDEIITYDKAGNIKTLNRGLYYLPGSTALNVVTNWSYGYSAGTNKLEEIQSLVSPGNVISYLYTYDANGSLRSDTKKDITQSVYGRGNLPVNISVHGSDLRYFYNDNDNRIYKENITDNSKEFYLQDGTGKTLGIYNLNGTSWTWYAHGKNRIAKVDGDSREFYVYDHLGNTRVTYTASVLCFDNSITYNVSNANDYYPYGKILRSYVGNGREKFLSTGHERDLETDLDYRGARFYDSDVARFLSLDPLAFKYSGWSSYNYVLANPLSYIDPDGRSAKWIPGIDKKGNLTLKAEKGDNLKTLKNFFKNDKKALKTFVKDKDLNPNRKFKTGETITLKEDNVLSKSINYANSVAGFETKKTYDCKTFVVTTLGKNEVATNQATITDPATFGIEWKNKSEITENQQVPGATFIYWAGLTDHAAVYFGKDNSGNEYTVTKNGEYSKPTVMKVDDLPYFLFLRSRTNYKYDK